MRQVIVEARGVVVDNSPVLSCLENERLERQKNLLVREGVCWFGVDVRPNNMQVRQDRIHAFMYLFCICEGSWVGEVEGSVYRACVTVSEAPWSLASTGVPCGCEHIGFSSSDLTTHMACLHLVVFSSSGRSGNCQKR